MTPPLIPTILRPGEPPVPALMVGFERERVQPPAPFLVTKDDQLIVVINTSFAGNFVRIRGRQILLNGEVKHLEQDFTPPTDRSTFSATMLLTDGWLLNLVAIGFPSAPKRGQTFVQVNIRRVTASSGTALTILFAGYLTGNGGPAWPGWNPYNPTEGPGLVRTIVGTNPAAGVEISETVPTGARWRLVSLRAPLVTAVAVANREPQLVFDDGANIWGAYPADAVQAASLTVNYTAGGVGATSVVAGGDSVIPIPTPLLLLAGWRIRTLTTNLQAADDWGAPVYMVEEWIEV